MGKGKIIQQFITIRWFSIVNCGKLMEIFYRKESTLERKKHEQRIIYEVKNCYINQWKSKKNWLQLSGEVRQGCCLSTTLFKSHVGHMLNNF